MHVEGAFRKNVRHERLYNSAFLSAAARVAKSQAAALRA